MANYGFSLAPGAHVRLGTLDFLATEEGRLEWVGALAPPPPSTSLDSAVEVFEKLQLNAPAAHAPERNQLPDSSYGKLRVNLGPPPSQEDLHALAFSFVNIVAELNGGEPISPDVSIRNASAAFPFGLRNAAGTFTSLATRRSYLPPMSSELVGMVDYAEGSVHDLLASGSESSAKSNSGEGSHHPSRECFMAEIHDDPVPSTRHPEEDAEAAHVPAASPPQQLSQLEQLQVRQRELDDARHGLELERAQLERELEHHHDGGCVRTGARDAHRRIVEDDDGLPRFARAGQNIAAAAALVRGLPAPTTPEEQRIQRGIRELLGRAAEQQAESSRSWRRGPGNGQPASSDRETGDTSVHQAPRGALTANLPPLRERVGPIRDARVILDARQRAKDDRRREAGVGYHPRRGRRFDVNEDRSPSPPPPGP